MDDHTRYSSYELTPSGPREAAGRGKALPPWAIYRGWLCLPDLNAILRNWNETSARDAPWARQNLLRILFVHRSVADVERCMFEAPEGAIHGQLRGSCDSRAVRHSTQLAAV